MKKMAVIVAAGLAVTIAVAYGQEKPTGKPNDTFEQGSSPTSALSSPRSQRLNRSAFVSLVLPEGTLHDQTGLRAHEPAGGWAPRLRRDEVGGHQPSCDTTFRRFQRW